MARTSSVKITNLVQKKERAKPSFAEIGGQSIIPFSWFTDEEAYDYSKVTVRQLEDMVDMDGQAQSILRLLTMPLRAAEITITPQKGGKAEADFIKSMLTTPPEQGGMETPWYQVINNMAHAVLTGAEFFEKVYELRNTNIIIKKIAHRPRQTLIVTKDKKGEWTGVKQQLPNGYEPIPKEKMMRWVIGAERNPLYGRSMFLPAYYHYEKKHKIYYISHIALAINAVGVRLAHVPEDASDIERQRFRQAIESLGFNTTITVPEGFELDVKSLGAVADPMNLINHHDSMMAKAVMGQVINMGGSESGNYNLSQTHVELLLVAEEAMMGEVAQQFNTDMIPELIDWNFGTGKYPTLKLRPRYTDRRSVVNELFTRIASARQVNTSPEFYLQIEKAMAEILGFADEVDYAAKEAEMIKNMTAKQNTVAGLTPDGKMKPIPKPVVGPAPGTPGSKKPGSKPTTKKPISAK
jgi:Protein of unknown function (DUF935)